MNEVDNLYKLKGILDGARADIARILAQTNQELGQAGLGRYSAVAAALFYNDPDELCDVPCLPILLEAKLPLQAGEPEELTVPVYSDTEGALLREFNVTYAAQITSGQCNRRKKGRPCGARGDNTTCKAITLYGHPTTYECLPSN